MDTQTRRRARQLLNALQAVRADMGDIPIQTLQTLLVVALDGETTQQQIGKRTGQSKAGVSRNVQAWTTWTRHRVPGPGFVEQFEDPMNRREKRVRPTPQGRAWLAQILEAMK